MATALGMTVAIVASIATAALYSSILRTSGLKNPLPLDWPSPPKPGINFPVAKNSLERMERLGEGKLIGPEDIAVDREGRYLYLACKDGWIKQFSMEDESVQNWTYVGGRPLGIAAGLHGEMIVCEPEKGLLNVTKDKVEVLSSQAAGLKYRLADGVVVAKDGCMYFTDASTAFNLPEFDLDFAEGRPYGRLLKYDPISKKTSVLLEGLYFPNGISLSENEDFIVFCESSQVRLQRYWLRGDKQGAAEIFVENLPGMPDNIHRHGNTFWVALLGGRSILGETALRLPLFKHLLGSSRFTLYYLHNSYARALAISEDGKPLELYESLQSKSIRMMTTGIQIGNSLYLGSFTSDYVGRIKLDSTAFGK